MRPLTNYTSNLLAFGIPFGEGQEFCGSGVDIDKDIGGNESTRKVAYFALDPV
jgi:hypothetical protein